MKNMRRILLLILSVIMLTATFAFVGCDCNGEEEPDSGYTLSVTPQQFNLVLGESRDLTVDLTPQPDAVLAFASEDESIASVSEEGTVTGNMLGETKITVTYGELSQQVTVIVVDGEYLPSLHFENVSDQETSIDFASTFNIGAYVMFNGKKYDDVTVTYALNDPNMATVENGVLSPLKKGSVTVTATATWRGFTNNELIKEFKINIIEYVSVVINDGATDLTIYTNEVAGATSADLAIKVNGQANSSAVLSVESGVGIVEIDGYKVKALTAGTAVVKATYEKDGIAYSDTITVNVRRPQVTYETVVPYFSADDGMAVGSVDLNDVFIEKFGASYELEEAKQGESILTVDGNKIKGVTPDIVKDDDGYAIGVQNVAISVSTADLTLNLTLTAYTKVIDEFNDLKYFELVQKEYSGNKIYPAEQDKKNGYYIMANNINANGQAVHADQLRMDTSTPFWAYTTVGSNDVNEGAYHEKYGLTGTFDGNGYSILNLQLNRGGIFGTVGLKATVKNLAVMGITVGTANNYSTSYSTSLLGTHVIGAKLENLYIEATSIENKGSNIMSNVLLATRLDATTVVNNCVIELLTPTTNEFTKGIIAGYLLDDQQNSNTRPWTNSFVISPMPLINVVDSATRDGAPKNPETYKKTLFMLDAANKVSGTQEYPVYTVSGIKRYDTLEQMTAAAGDNTAILNTFDEAYWTIVDGIPCWNNNPYYHTTIESFSANDGVSMSATKTLAQAIEEKFGANANITATQGETDLTVESGYVIKGVTPNITGTGTNRSVLPATITVTDGTKTVYYTVMAYTQVLNEASDLSAFAHGATVTTTDGYFLLNGNLDATSFDMSAANSGDSKFIGVFDGNGYTISNLKVNGKGLFSAIRDKAVIKNVAFVNAGAVNRNYNSDIHLLGWDLQDCLISNVYIQSTSYRLIREGLLGRVTSLAVLNNVVVNAETYTTDDKGWNGMGENASTSTVNNDLTANTKYGAFTASMSSGDRNNFATSTGSKFTANQSNVYVISPIKLYVDNTAETGFTIDAGAVDGVANSADTFIMSSIKRYTSLDTFKAAEGNDYSSFTDSGFWTITDNIPVWKTLNA